jgi:uncharacterized tellurite resistance protein B-like protein
MLRDRDRLRVKDIRRDDEGSSRIVIDALCCVMAADRTASRIENQHICEAMEEWSPSHSREDVIRSIKSFLQLVKHNGYAQRLEAALHNASELKLLGMHRKLLHALGAVAASDGDLSKPESKVIDRFRVLFDSSSVSEVAQPHDGNTLLQRLLATTIPAPLVRLGSVLICLLAAYGVFTHVYDITSDRAERAERFQQSFTTEFPSFTRVGGASPYSLYTTRGAVVPRKEFERLCRWRLNSILRYRQEKAYATHYVFVVDDDITIEYPSVYTDGRPYNGTVSLKSTGEKIGVLNSTTPSRPHGPAFLRGHLKAVYYGSVKDVKRGVDSGTYWYEDGGENATE